MVPDRYRDAYEDEDVPPPDLYGFEAMYVEWPAWMRDLADRHGYTLRQRVDPSRECRKLYGYHADNEITQITHGTWPKFELVAGMRHELAHALVWEAHGRPGRTQWGVGPIDFFSDTHPIEPLIGAVEFGLLSRFEGHHSAAGFLRDLVSRDEDTPAFEDFAEAARVLQLAGPGPVKELRPAPCPVL